LRISIAEETRQEVVTKWLSGWARDKIAGEIGIGAGTVTNIIAQWTN
jgi:transposase